MTLTDKLVAYLPLLLTFRPLLYGFLMWSVCLYAGFRGGWEERIAISVIVVNTYTSVLAVAFFQLRYTEVELPLVAVDAAMFLLLYGIALRSKKFWPLWLAAFAGVALLSHLAPLMPGMFSQLYYDATALWSYPQLLVLAIGIANHRRTSVCRINCETRRWS